MQSSLRHSDDDSAPPLAQSHCPLLVRLPLTQELSAEESEDVSLA